MVVYGIKNCDSVKKARAFLELNQLNYRFHDYRLDGLDSELLQTLIDALGLEIVLNQRSTSWRQLTDEQKQNLTVEKALGLMLEQPALIKRPILQVGQRWLVGFNSDLYQTLI